MYMVHPIGHGGVVGLGGMAGTGSVESSAFFWPCRCVTRMDISAEAEATATTQDGKVRRSGLYSAARSVRFAMSVIGSSKVCGRFWADQC